MSEFKPHNPSVQELAKAAVQRPGKPEMTAICVCLTPAQSLVPGVRVSGCPVSTS